MSFSKFGIKNLLNVYDQRLKDLESEINEHEKLRFQLDMSPYRNEVEYKLKSLNRDISRKLEQKNSVSEIINELEKLDQLEDEDKQKLYYFYEVLQTDIRNYISKMPFNYEFALSDVKINKLMNDEDTPDDLKLIVAQAIYDNFKMSPEHSRELVLILRTDPVEDPDVDGL